MKNDSGSFRDPSGTVFTRNGEVLRAVFAPGAESYARAKEKGIFERLSRKGSWFHMWKSHQAEKAFPREPFSAWPIPGFPW
jgi:hypothetical protein